MNDYFCFVKNYYLSCLACYSSLLSEPFILSSVLLCFIEISFPIDKQCGISSSAIIPIISPAAYKTLPSITPIGGIIKPTTNKINATDAHIQTGI